MAQPASSPAGRPASWIKGAALAALVPLVPVVIGPACGGSGPEPTARPSIAVILIDTLRADRLGCYGYERPTSPRIDALARSGVVFERALAQSTWTKPTTASIHTGLYPSRHGATTPFATLRPEHETLAEVLREHGYRTAALGSNPHIFGGTGFEQGFDAFEEVPAAAVERIGHARAETIVDRALAWLASGPADEPFFIYVHLFDPHAPYDPPEPYRGRFDGGVRGEHDQWYMLQTGVTATDLSAEDWEHYRDLYDAEVAYTDAEVGRLLDALDLERTAVILLADHGEELFDHGGWSHTSTLFEELVHIPLIARFPGPAGAELAGERYGGLVQQVDVLPTVLDLLGLPARPGLPGESLLARARGAAPPASHGISEVDEFKAFRKAVVAERLKYIHGWSPEPGEALYDLFNDPGESRDVLAEEPAEAARLRALLDEHVRGAPARYALVVHNGTEESMTLGGYLVTERGRVRGSDVIDSEFDFEGAPDFDGPYLFLDGDIDGRAVKAVQFTLRTRPGDTDGFYFTPEPGETLLSIYLNQGAGPPDPSLVHLGAAGLHPSSTSPVALDLTTPERYASPTAPEPGEGYAIHLWRTVDAPGAEQELDEETREALKRLGYAGDR